MICAADGLGLVPVWARTQGWTVVLEWIFGMTQTPVSDFSIFYGYPWLRLTKDGYANIMHPNIEQLAVYQNAVRQHHPTLERVGCTMDGIK